MENMSESCVAFLRIGVEKRVEILEDFSHYFILNCITLRSITLTYNLTFNFILNYKQYNNPLAFLSLSVVDYGEKITFCPAELLQ